MLSIYSDFTIFIRAGEILPETVLFGAHGGVVGGANMFHGLFANLFGAAKTKICKKRFYCRIWLYKKIKPENFRVLKQKK